MERHEQPRPGSTAPWRVILAEGNAAIQLVYFNPRADWLKKIFPLGARRIVSGEVEWFDMRPQIAHPEYVLDAGACRRAAAARAGLWPHRGPFTEGGAAGRRRRRSSALPDAAGMAFAGPACRDAAGRAFREALTPHPPAARHRGGRADRRRPGSGSPSTSSSASQLALMLVRGSLRRGRGTAWRAEGRLAQAHRRRPPLQPDAVAAAGARRRSRAISPARTACCGCCRAMSAPARRSSR